MYNLYTYEKRKKDLDENSKNYIDNKEYIKKRDKLAKRFYSRINNIIFDLAKKPIIINNDYYLSSEKNNYSFQRSKFETHRERIEKFLKTQRDIEFQKKPINIIKKNKFKNKFFINDSFNDSINNNSELIPLHSDEYSYRKKYNKIKNIIKKENEERIDKYLIKINNDKIKENQKDKSTISKMKIHISTKNNKEIKDLKHKFNLNKKILSFKNETKINLNKTSKYFLKNKSYNSLRIKTYFNSIQQSIICNSKENSYKNNPQKVIKKFKGLKSSSSDMNLYNQHNRYSLLNNNTNNDLENVEDLKLNKINKEICNSVKDKMRDINITYHNYKDEIINKHEKKEVNDLEMIKQIAMEDKNVFMKNNQEKNLKFEHKGFSSRYDLFSNIKDDLNLNEEDVLEDENIILYNNQVYFKDDQNDINKLGKIILKKCHFVNKKFDNNKDNKLQKGNGKLMITNGLSINEFIDKFSLPNKMKKI